VFWSLAPILQKMNKAGLKDSQFPTQLPAFHVMVKPVGPKCNLNCTYCYYNEKRKLYPDSHRFYLSEKLLEKFISDFIAARDEPVVIFNWQGGEPTLLGLDYFRKVVDIQKRYAGDKQIENSLQTNGTLLTDEFCAFLRSENFLVGISVDGPKHLHDHYRTDRQGRPSWEKVMAGIGLLKKHGVEFNTLTTINRQTADHPIEVYQFLKKSGSRCMQFIPVVERVSNEGGKDHLRLVHHCFKGVSALTPWSVLPYRYGQFLISIFDEWVKNDVGKYFVQMFDATLANWVGVNPGLCVFNQECGSSLVMEHNGDFYSCDHFVYREHLLGNIQENPIIEILASSKLALFSQAKTTGLPPACFRCSFLNLCYGGCPKHRFNFTAGGERGLNYLCEGLKMFFSHAAPYMDFMAKELKNARTPANVMQWAKKMTNAQNSSQSEHEKYSHFKGE
jgi:uncharacterized protein